MFSLFSSFDYFWLVFFKFSELFLFLLVAFCLTYQKSFFLFFWNFFKVFFFKFFSSLLSAGYSKLAANVFLCVMFFVLCLNFFSVFPFVFAHSAQVSNIFSLGFGIWMSLMIFMLACNSKGFGSHLIPEGSPMVLVPALLMIEVVSCIIRPVTLTVRLVANILAGHLLMVLLSKIILAQNFTYPLFFLLNTVEIFVSFIQAYIFMTMIILYFCDLF